MVIYYLLTAIVAITITIAFIEEILGFLGEFTRRFKNVIKAIKGK
jgi:hypothetical protein